MPRRGERIPVEDRIRAGVTVNASGCWLWRRVNRGGYGVIEMREGVGRAARKRRSAHRVAYEAFVGPIPDGLTIDHLCRVRNCVNPDHLEPVTGYVNLMRGEAPPALNARKTHCPQGHEYTPENTKIRNGERACRACHNAADRVRWATRRRAA